MPAQRCQGSSTAEAIRAISVSSLAICLCRFFFYFQARVEPDTAPVVLWMTGGPGCSSELAVFFENGQLG